MTKMRIGEGMCEVMGVILRSFAGMLRSIQEDRMLLAAVFAPPLAGIAIRYVLPFGDERLAGYTGAGMLLSPYYGLLDVFLASLTAVMFCFVASMVMLEERDEHIDCAMFVTSLGKRGYFVSRVGIPALAAFAVTAVLLPVFRLSDLSAWEVLVLSLVGALQGVIIALLIVLISSNKLEGMAVAKISSLIILGAVVPYFLPAALHIGFIFLPSFWAGAAIRNHSSVFLLISVGCAGGWITILCGKLFRIYR